MFRWFKKMIGNKSRPVDWEAFNREDERNDKDYLCDFSGERNGTSFEDANCHVKFFYGNGPAPRYRTIRGKNTIFQSGKIVSGDYKCDVWDNGEFCGDTLKCRFFNGGTFSGKHLICEQVTGGVCNAGMVECGSWNNAEFAGDVLVVHNWISGIFSGNVFHGKWRGGEWCGKKFKGIDLSGQGLED